MTTSTYGLFVLFTSGSLISLLLGLVLSLTQLVALFEENCSASKYVLVTLSLLVVASLTLNLVLLLQLINFHIGLSHQNKTTFEHILEQRQIET